MLLKHFIVGTALPVLFLHFYLVYHNEKKTYTYFLYTFLAPLFIGIMNILKHSLFDNKYINNFFFTYLSANLVFLISYFSKSYEYNEREWMFYYIRLHVLHFYIYNIIYIIEWFL
jgi:hypothetical protein